MISVVSLSIINHPNSLVTAWNEWYSLLYVVDCWPCKGLRGLISELATKLESLSTWYTRQFVRLLFGKLHFRIYTSFMISNQSYFVTNEKIIGNEKDIKSRQNKRKIILSAMNRYLHNWRFLRIFGFVMLSYLVALHSQVSWCLFLYWAV